jgi:hypothetical protein
MTGRNFSSPWIAAIEKYTLDGVKNTIREKCESVSVSELASKTYEPNLEKVAAWYGVILYIKKRKNHFQYFQRNKEGCTIPVDNYARFVVIQEINTENTVVMFVPGTTLGTNFFLQKISWIGSGVVLLDPSITGIWNDNPVISTKHPFIPFNINKNLHQLPKIDCLPHSFRFNQSSYQGFCFDNLNPPDISELNIVPACPNVFCDSNHGFNDTCPAVVGTRCMKKNCLEGSLSLPSATEAVKIPFMSMEFTSKLVDPEIIANPNRYVESSFLREIARMQFEIIKEQKVQWFVLGWYRVKKEISGLQSFVSKFHITKISCNADTELIKLPPRASELRPEHYFPDIYRNRIIIPTQTDKNQLGNELENGTEVSANENVQEEPESTIEEEREMAIENGNIEEEQQEQQVETNEIAIKSAAVSKAWERSVTERNRILSLNESVNRPLTLRWLETLGGSRKIEKINLFGDEYTNRPSTSSKTDNRQLRTAAKSVNMNLSDDKSTNHPSTSSKTENRQLHTTAKPVNRGRRGGGTNRGGQSGHSRKKSRQKVETPIPKGQKEITDFWKPHKRSTNTKNITNSPEEVELSSE